jgi:hypothetical protein
LPEGNQSENNMDQTEHYKEGWRKRANRANEVPKVKEEAPIQGEEICGNQRQFIILHKHKDGNDGDIESHLPSRNDYISSGK